MTAQGMVERLVLAGRAKGGERLEIANGSGAVLVVNGARLKAGATAFGPEELTAWIESAIDREKFVAFELGEPVACDVDIADERFPVMIRRDGETVRVDIDLRTAGPAEGAGEPAAADVAVAPREAGGKADAAPTQRPLDRMLRRLVALHASDLHLSAGFPPFMRLHGDIMPAPEFTLALSSEHILMMCEEVAPAASRQEFRATNDTDFAYEIGGVARFRANLFRDRRGVCAVFRQIPEEILSFDQLGLPDCVKTLCMLNKGLVLVTGPTGSGKSTTLATMIDYVNAHRADHVITIEDPIEFVHENKRCLVNQRQVHAHTESFKRALRAALREDPDIVLVGELRDLETMGIAIETAETGHLVFATLHTTTAVSTVDRMIDQFPADRQEQIRVMLAQSLKGVIAQTLLKRVGGGRVAAYEILLGVTAVSNLIREGKTFQIPSIMQTAKRLGMRTLNDALAELVKNGVVEVEEALAKAIDKDGLRSLLKLGQSEETGIKA